MKKVLFVAALLGVTGAFAADSYLYWMVDTTSAKDYGYTYARIKAVNSGLADPYLTIYDASFGSPYQDGAGGKSGVSKADINDFADWDDGFYASLAGVNLESATFFVELYNDSGFLARNYSASAGEISGFIYSGGISGVAPAVPWTAGSFDIPEPSSGLLLLVGCAVLGLRRRRQASVIA